MAVFRRIPEGEVTLDQLAKAIGDMHDCLHQIADQATQDREIAEQREDLRRERHELLREGQDEISKRVGRIEAALGVQVAKTPTGEEKVRRILAGVTPWKFFTGFGGAIIGYSFLAKWIEPGLIIFAQGCWAALAAIHHAWMTGAAPPAG